MSLPPESACSGLMEAPDGRKTKEIKRVIGITYI